jgi:hypothetical protein
MNCFATSLRRRMARILTALAGSLAVTAATAQAALAQPWPQKVPSHLGPPVHIRTVVIGGMPGWQIALIAVAGDVCAAAAAVVADRAWARRRPLPAGAAGEPTAVGGEGDSRLSAVTLGPGRW